MYFKKIYKGVFILKTYDLMKRGLDVTTLRGKAIANNIANINTANYKRSYVTFEETLSNTKNLSMKTSNKRHITNNSNYGDYSLKKDMSVSMREDGNNVDLETEKVDQAANSLQYNALITLTSNKLNGLKTVITGR